MERSAFIKWLESDSGFSRKYDSSDNEWRELMNYAEYIWDELYIEEDKVIFNWEDWSWGNIEYKTRECSFEEFVELYKTYNLK